MTFLSISFLTSHIGARVVVPLPDQIRPGAINPKSVGIVNDYSVCAGDICFPPAIRPELASFCQSLTVLEQESGAAFASAANLLVKYCQNAATSDDPKFRRIKKANRAFARDLAPFRSALDCLRAVGFKDKEDEGGEALLVLTGEPDKQLLQDAAAAIERPLMKVELRERWPAALLSELNRCVPS